jgi:hypothetical protein
MKAAEPTRLEAALKLLPAEFASDPEREARVLASLHHPNIAAVFGLEA